VRAVRRIPVIGNGDVTTPQAAKMMFEETGCAGVSIGRGALYHPWIFRDTAYFLSTGQSPPEPDFEQRVQVMRRHLDLMVEVFGEEHGCRMFRKIGPWHSKRFGPANEFNKRIVKLSNFVEFNVILDDYRRWRRQFLDDDGRLQPRYRPAPLADTFLREPAVAQRTEIPVPKGPVEVW
jgi:tRNA-dihydrouridine synthase